jgi:hypothetical protein
MLGASSMVGGDSGGGQSGGGQWYRGRVEAGNVCLMGLGRVTGTLLAPLIWRRCGGMAGVGAFGACMSAAAWLLSAWAWPLKGDGDGSGAGKGEGGPAALVECGGGLQSAAI